MAGKSVLVKPTKAPKVKKSAAEIRIYTFECKACKQVVFIGGPTIDTSYGLYIAQCTNGVLWHSLVLKSQKIVTGDE